MRITESKLRNIIRQVIRESMHSKDLEYFASHPDPSVGPEPGTSHRASAQRSLGLKRLLQSLPVEAGPMGFQDSLYGDDLYYVGGEVELFRSEAEESLRSKLSKLSADDLQGFSVDEVVNYVLDQGTPVGSY